MVASGTPISPENPALARRQGRSIAERALPLSSRRGVPSARISSITMKPKACSITAAILVATSSAGSAREPAVYIRSRMVFGGGSGVAKVPPFQRDDIRALFDHCKNPRPRRRIMRTCGFVAPGRDIVRARRGVCPLERCRGQCRPNTKKAEPCPAFDRPADACLRPSA